MVKCSVCGKEHGPYDGKKPWFGIGGNDYCTDDACFKAGLRALDGIFGGKTLCANGVPMYYVKPLEG